MHPCPTIAPKTGFFSPIARRRFATFKANRRGYLSAIILLALFALSAFAELLANDKPLLVSYKGHWLFPVMATYTEKDTFGGVLESEADYNDPWVVGEINAHGWLLRAPIPFSYRSINFHNWQRKWCTCQLQIGLFKMVAVQMHIATCPNQFPYA